MHLGLTLHTPPPNKGEERKVGDDEIRLFVGGLPDGCGEADLMELFADAEPVEAFVCRQKHPPCTCVPVCNCWYGLDGRGLCQLGGEAVCDV